MTVPVGVATAEASGTNPDALNSINSNVELYNEFFSKEHCRSSVDTIYELITTKSIQRKIELLVNEVTDEIAKNHIWTQILDNKTTDKYEEIRNNLIIGIVAHLMTINPDVVPENMQNLVAQKSFAIHKMDSLCSNIDLTGHISLYAEEIQKQLDTYNNVFIKIQAKLIFDDFIHNNKGKRVKRSDFYKVMEKVRGECNSLQELLNEQEKATVV
jgi:hypothetical protein